MNRFFEFVLAHPLLIAATVLVALVALVLEVRHRARGSAAVGPTEAVLLANQGALMLDVRTDEQYAEGHIIDSRHLKSSDLASSAETLKKYRDKPIVVYCDTGATSAAAARLLKSQGFTKVVNLRGGVQAWKQDNLPLVKETGKGAGRLQAVKSEKAVKTA